jgi:tetratricopeptide (TPR) repeat protein
VKTRATTAAEFARELEAQLDEYPEERGHVLTEAAEYWHRAGEDHRAIELLTDAIAIGGEDGDNARVSFADVLFDLGRVDEARAQLAALRQCRPPTPTPYLLAAELLEERAEYQEALTWFNMAVSRISEPEMADRHGWVLSYANLILGGRRRVRETLGLPPDELDDSVPNPRIDPFTRADDLARGLARGAPRPGEVRVAFWPRDEIPRAHERWPQLVEHMDGDSIVHDREMANRDLFHAGIARITMVPLTARALAEFAGRTGRDPADEATRHACMEVIIDDGGAISWPPPRNAPCWCGSGAKYKKCCGGPNLVYPHNSGPTVT